LAPYLQDAARTPGGHAAAVFLPRSEGEVAWVLREAPAVLPVGAQSSLTGGATPFGESVLSLARLDAIGLVTDGTVRAGAGVALSSLEESVRPQGVFFPPVPTFRGALVGGVCSTNAAGASTFKYGSTRDWVRGLTVVLASGEVLELARGDCRARDGTSRSCALTGRRWPCPSRRTRCRASPSAPPATTPGRTWTWWTCSWARRARWA
jgi:D-lactate dehydrogenase (cytochrome)